MCGNKVEVGGFYIQQKLRRGDCIKSQYYNLTKNERKGRRLITDEVYAICYSSDDIVGGRY